MEETKELEVAKPQELPSNDIIEGDINTSSRALEHVQRIGKMYAQSKFVPSYFQGSISDCCIAVVMANSFGVQPLFLMQKVYPVNGKMGLEAQLVIALVNKSGIYKNGIEWELTGAGETLSCTAKGFNTSTNIEETETFTYQDAKAWGWVDKTNSLWKKDPKMFLKYRTASRLIRFNHPEILLGMYMKEELEEMTDATPKESQSQDLNNMIAASKPAAVTEVQSKEGKKIGDSNASTI